MKERTLIHWDDISDDVYFYIVQTWKDGRLTANKTVSKDTPTFTFVNLRDGEYRFKLMAYSKSECGLLEPYVVDVTVVDGEITVSLPIE